MSEQLRLTFVMEQHVGHKTYGLNLRSVVDRDPEVVGTWVPVTYETGRRPIERFSIVPWNIRAAAAARREARAAIQGIPADARLFFTQVPAVLAGRVVRERPYVIVLDVTPIQYDAMAAPYGHKPDTSAVLRRIKKSVNERALRRAHHLVPYSNWVRDSLVDDYGVPPEKMTVVPAGVDVSIWRPRTADHTLVDSERLKVLFVGGEFERKGGPMAVRAVRSLPQDEVEFHIVTRSRVEDAPNIFVHQDMQPNSAELVELYQRCDVLVLPSRADTFGHVILEAAACGLPAIVSDVGAMPEIVGDGVTGFVVPSNDWEAIAGSLRLLLDDRDRLTSMGLRARTRAECEFDIRVNGARTLEILKAAARSSSRRPA